MANKLSSVLAPTLVNSAIEMVMGESNKPRTFDLPLRAIIYNIALVDIYLMAGSTVSDAYLTQSNPIIITGGDYCHEVSLSNLSNLGEIISAMVVQEGIIKAQTVFMPLLDFINRLLQPSVFPYANEVLATLVKDKILLNFNSSVEATAYLVLFYRALPRLAEYSGSNFSTLTVDLPDILLPSLTLSLASYIQIYLNNSAIFYELYAKHIERLAVITKAVEIHSADTLKQLTGAINDLQGYNRSSS